MSGEWLTQTGLTGQPLEINVMAGKVVIRGSWVICWCNER
nr:SymE family type I addiction module toxin [Yersinia similis]